MVGNVTQDKKETMTSISVNVKYQQNIVHVKRIVPEILEHVSASMTKIVRLANI